MRNTVLLPVAIAALAAATPAAAAEMLDVPFTGDSVGTAELYSGIVNIRVSGTGQSGGDDVNDAFYRVESASPNTGLYQLGFNTAAFDPANASFAAANRIIGGRPAFNAGNSYSFQIDVGASPTRLFFANIDDFRTDNSGAYTITVGNVPEPASWAMMIGGFGVVGGAARARRRTRVTFA